MVMRFYRGVLSHDSSVRSARLISSA